VAAGEPGPLSDVRDVATVGIIGWGRMGREIGKALLQRGRPVVAVDPDPDAGVAIEASGATRAATAAEVAAASELVLVVVVDDDQVRAAITGPQGALEGARPGTIIGICASVRPDTCTDLARTGEEHGVHVIDVALVGGERGAEQAALRLMCGGPPEVVDRCRPAFSAFATDVCHIGSVGTGQVAKTANNILLWACIRADVEALKLAQALGVEPGKLRAFLNVGSGANKPLAEWGMHRLRWPAKDLEVALGMAQEAGVDMPLVSTLQGLMAELTTEDLNALR
jgi:3-hydroxyisobutyrate dehydrogenase-like beta-hydroxyacid dehydrogenase